MSRNPGTSVRLDKAIESFLNALAVEDISEKGIQSKRRTLAILSEVTGRKNRSTRKLTVEDFEECLRMCKNGLSPEENAKRALKALAPRTGRTPQSLKQDRSALNQFAKYLRRQGWVSPKFDPSYRITHAARDVGTKDPDKVRRYRHVPFEDWPALLEAAGAHHPRTRMIVAVGLFWGRRVSEVAYIRFKHIDLDRNRVELFNIKRGRPVGSSLPIGDWMRAELDRYLTWYRLSYGEPQPDWYLCPNKVHASKVSNRSDTRSWGIIPTRACSVKAIIDGIKRALRGIGWTDDMLLGEGGHTLRRSAAIAVGAEEGDAAAQALLDHKTLDQTFIYTRNRAGTAALKRAMTGIAPPSAPEPEPEPVKESEPEPEVASNVVDFAAWRARKAG